MNGEDNRTRNVQGIWVAVGIGVATDNLALGIGIGVAIGVVLGTVLSKR